MNPVKRALLQAVEQMEDEDAARLLEMAQELCGQETVKQVLARLAGDPTFEIPEDSFAGFADFEPAPVRGRPASETLVGDRR